MEQLVEQLAAAAGTLNLILLDMRMLQDEKLTLACCLAGAGLTCC